MEEQNDTRKYRREVVLSMPKWKDTLYTKFSHPREQIFFLFPHDCILIHSFIVSLYKQVFLQGHIHEIQCFTACPKKKFIASADCGPDPMLIIWNVENGQVGYAITIFFIQESWPLWNAWSCS
jgi:hypothetical protein